MGRKESNQTNKNQGTSSNEIVRLKHILKIKIHRNKLFKAAYPVTFDLLIFELLCLMFLFFKNTVKKLKFRYTFYQFRKS